MPTDPGRLGGVYLLTPDAQGAAFERVLVAVAQALDAGVTAVQYRNKAVTEHERAEQAARLVQLVHAVGGLAIVNDSVELACAAGSDGVHLGRGDGDVAAARARLGGRWLGVSCYDDFERAERAVAAGADAIAFGSVFASTTKPAAVRAPLSLLTRARQQWPQQRVIAIGGIDRGNIATVAAAGAHAAAVIAAVFDADDPGASARELVELFQQGQRRHESQRAAV